MATWSADMSLYAQLSIVIELSGMDVHLITLPPMLFHTSTCDINSSFALTILFHTFTKCWQVYLLTESNHVHLH